MMRAVHLGAALLPLCCLLTGRGGGVLGSSAAAAGGLESRQQGYLTEAQSFCGSSASRPGRVACTSYCAQMMKHCQGNDEKYGSYGECVRTCVALPADGAIGDHLGDTFQCRATWAAYVAITKRPNSNCDSAGPTGSGVCGYEEASCHNYCRFLANDCEHFPQFADDTACKTACAKMSKTALYDALVPSDSLQCRMWHINLAMVGHESRKRGGPKEHCHNAGPRSDVCVASAEIPATREELCKLFCDATAEFCVGRLRQFATTALCHSYCLALPDLGKVGDRRGPSVHCHLKMAGVAARATERAVWCQHKHLCRSPPVDCNNSTGFIFPYIVDTHHEL